MLFLRLTDVLMLKVQDGYNDLWGVVLYCAPILMEENMTDKKKISILERLLDERDNQIRELQERNAELQYTIDEYSNINTEFQELKNIIKEAKQLRSELNITRHEQLKSQEEYRKEMMTFFLNNTNKFR